MGLFLICFFVIFIYLVRKTRYRCLAEPLYWLSLFWFLILGVYFTSGIQYKYGLSFQTSTFLFICCSLFLCGYHYGFRRSTRCFVNKELTSSVNKYIIAGIMGVIAFAGDYVRLNGIAEGKSTDTQISIIGSIGSLFVPILLLLGLYLNAVKIKKQDSFDMLGVILIIGYSIPCMINAGREAILFAIIGIMCMFGYKSILQRNEKKRHNKTIFIIIGIFIVVGLAFTIIQISQKRFTDNEINVLLTYRDVSSKTMNDASSWGSYEFLYYNIASYFSHQIPFLDFTLREYDGPYMCGMYELNIISRRLPEFLELDYNLAFAKLGHLFNSKRETFSGAWNTVLGSLIIDFTWVGAIILTLVCGIIIGKARKKFIKTKDARYATLISLICLSTFSTIQLGPFFQTQIYGAFIWWYILFRKYEKKRIT